MILSSSFRAGLMLGLPLFAFPVFAQPKEREESHSRRADIIVTGVAQDDSYAPKRASVAGKIPSDILEIPQSISIMTRQQIEDRNLFTIGEAVHTMAGITVMPFDGTNPDYRARGFVLDYAYDGIPSTFSSGVPEFDLVVYERLEVQRGPTGLFRGSGSPGGTINLVRKRGQDIFAVSAGLSGGSWNNYRGEFDVGGPIDAAGRLRIRAVGALNDRDFFQDKSHTRKFTGHTAIDFDLTESTIVGASVSYQNTKADTPMNGQAAFTNQRFLNFPRSFQHLPDWNRFTETTTEYAGEVKQRVGNWMLVVRGLHRDIPRAWEDAFIRPGTGIDPVTLTAEYVNRRARGENGKTSVDAYAAGHFTLFGREHELAVGYSWDKRTSSFLQRTQTSVGRHSIFNADAIPIAPNLFTSGSETDLRQSGFHAQLRLRPIGGLTIVAGGRISDYTNKTRGIAPSKPSGFATGARERNRFTPSLGAVLHLTDNITIYGSYSDIFNPQTALRIGGSVLEPRIGEQYEAGLKGRFANGNLNASAAIFRSRDKNRALADTANPGFFVQAGEVSIKGFEFEVTGRPAEGLDLVGSYTNVKTEYEVGTAAQTGAIFDIFTPHHQYKFYARYEPSMLNGAFASFSLNGQSGVVGSGVAKVRQQGGFATVGAQVGWRFDDHLRAFLSVTNLLDKIYYSALAR